MIGTKARLVRNAAFSSISWAANVIINLVTIPLIVRYLGVEAFGIYALLTGLFGYFALLDLGLGQGLIRYVSHYHGLRDNVSLTDAVNAALTIQIIVGVAGLLLILAFDQKILELLNLSDGYYRDAEIGLRIASVGFFLTMLFGNYSFALQGLQRYAVIGKVNMLFSVCTAAGVIVALMLGGGLIEIVMLSVAFSSLNSLMYLILFKRYYSPYRVRLKANRATVKALFGFSGYVLVSRIVNVLNNYALRFLISVFWGPQAVAAYVVPMKLTSAVQGGLGSLAGVVFPFTSESASRGEEVRMQSVYVKASAYLAGLTISLLLFLSVYSREVLDVWMGGAFSEEVWHVLFILSLAAMLSATTMVPTNAVLGLGYSRQVAVFSLTVLIINVGACSWLTATHGALGAAVGILLTQVVALPFVWYSTEKLVHVRWKEYVKEVFTPNGLPAAVLLLVAAVPIATEHLLAFKAPVLTLTIGLGSLCIYYIMLQRRGLSYLTDIKLFVTGLRT